MIAILIVLAVIFGLFAFVVVFGAPFVPTRAKWARAALDLAQIGQGDVLVDLGSGSGTVLRLAAERGARAVGYELNPILAALSILCNTKCRGKMQVKIANFWAMDLPTETTVVYVFAVARDEEKLIKYLEKQAKKVKVKELKVVTFGLPLSGRKSLGQAQGANLYKF